MGLKTQGRQRGKGGEEEAVGGGGALMPIDKGNQLPGFGDVILFLSM